VSLSTLPITKHRYKNSKVVGTITLEANESLDGFTSTIKKPKEDVVINHYQVGTSITSLAQLLLILNQLIYDLPVNKLDPKKMTRTQKTHLIWY
jgi:hypothetical protein